MKPVARPQKDWNEEYKKFASAYEVLYEESQNKAQVDQNEQAAPESTQEQAVNSLALTDLIERREETCGDSIER